MYSNLWECYLVTGMTAQPDVSRNIIQGPHHSKVPTLEPTVITSRGPHIVMVEILAKVANGKENLRRKRSVPSAPVPCAILKLPSADDY